MAVGNHTWGAGTTKKLLKLFPALEAIELVSAWLPGGGGVCYGLLDRAHGSSPHTDPPTPVSPRHRQGSTKKVGHAHSLKDFSLAAIPSLRKFKWSWAFNSDDAVVMNVVRGRELLEELDLSNAEGMGEWAPSGLTDQLLLELGKSCPSLRTLRLQGHLQFTSEVRTCPFSDAP